MELPAGADGKLGEHLAQVVLNGAGAMNRRAPISGFDRRSRASRGDLGLLGSQRSASRAACGRAGRCAYGLSRRWSAARGGRARRTPPSPLRPASGMRCATGRAPRRYGHRDRAVSRRMAGTGGVLAAYFAINLCLAGGVLAAVTIRNPRPEGRPARQQLLHCALNAPASPVVPHR
jgi:hypothetical protein